MLCLQSVFSLCILHAISPACVVVSSLSALSVLFVLVCSPFLCLQARSEEQLASDKAWLLAEKVWLIHKGGFAAAKLLREDKEGGDSAGKCRVKLEKGGQVIEVEEEDVEKVNVNLKQ